MKKGPWGKPEELDDPSSLVAYEEFAAIANSPVVIRSRSSSSRSKSGSSKGSKTGGSA